MIDDYDNDSKLVNSLDRIASDLESVLVGIKVCAVLLAVNAVLLFGRIVLGW